MKKAFYCSCGAAFVGTIVKLIQQARALHLAEGHRETNAKGAAAARRKAESAG